MATIDIDNSNNIEIEETAEVPFNYANRAQWLRAALLGANDGLLSTATIMIGVGAVSKDIATMIISGIATLIGGACSMAIGEFVFVSVYSQYDIELSQFKRDIKSGQIDSGKLKNRRRELPSPTKAALASACAFTFGALVPLLAAVFIHNYHVRLGVVVGVVSLALIGFGGLSAFLGGAPMVKPTLRTLIGGWLAMAITFGLTKAVGSAGLVVT